MQSAAQTTMPHATDPLADLPPPPGGLALSPIDGADPDVIAAADRAARHWTDAEPGPLVPGAPAHARAVAAMFRDTFNPYKPSVIPWPVLDDETRERVTSLPIWDIAVQTEGRAMRRMQAYADTVTDPSWREPLQQNAWEEGRHKQVLARMVAFYGIQLAPEPPYPIPRHTEWAYLVTGFSECVDSFFAFGLFELARRSDFFPIELVDTFEPVMQEECRHILLFANWLAAHRARMPWWRRPFFEVTVWAVWAFLGWERIGIARGMDDGKGGKAPAQDNNFTLTGSKAVSSVDVSIGELMAICLEENERRFAGYDMRFRRPTTTPAIARMICRFTRRKPRPAT
jgi:hypothetical protein